MYDQFGRYVEYEPDEPVRRTHCKQCGGFLPKTPTVYTNRDGEPAAC